MSQAFFVQHSCSLGAGVTAAALLATLHLERIARSLEVPERRRRDPSNCEGKIKGAARACLECESARGFGAARRLVVSVPRANAGLRVACIRGVPSTTCFATFCRGRRRGIA
jgi:hypothetical protein